MQRFTLSNSLLGNTRRDEENLTDRELEVLQHIAEGKEAKEVARLLGCAKRTVDFHMANIFEKFQVNNRLRAIHVASERGLLP